MSSALFSTASLDEAVQRGTDAIEVIAQLCVDLGVTEEDGIGDGAGIGYE